VATFIDRIMLRCVPQWLEAVERPQLLEHRRRDSWCSRALRFWQDHHPAHGARIGVHQRRHGPGPTSASQRSLSARIAHGVVFQTMLLSPHMTWPKHRLRAQAAAAAQDESAVNVRRPLASCLSEHLRRSPCQLSAARASVWPWAERRARTRRVLMDEPLSKAHATRLVQMRREIVRLQTTARCAKAVCPHRSESRRLRWRPSAGSCRDPSSVRQPQSCMRSPANLFVRPSSAHRR